MAKNKIKTKQSARDESLILIAFLLDFLVIILSFSLSLRFAMSFQIRVSFWLLLFDVDNIDRIDNILHCVALTVHEISINLLYLTLQLTL